MYCPKCGKDAGNERFCPGCGTDIKTETAYKPSFLSTPSTPNTSNTSNTSIWQKIRQFFSRIF